METANKQKRLLDGVQWILTDVAIGAFLFLPLTGDLAPGAALKKLKRWIGK